MTSSGSEDEDLQTSRESGSPPRVDDLLVALSTAGHGEEEVGRIRATVEALATNADVSGSVLARSREEALRLALVVAMRRRNHELSMAPGNGAGERDPLRTVLLEVHRFDADAVAKVLPLVPTYGSWRDMLVLGEQFLDRAVQEGRFSGPSIAPSDNTSAGEGSIARRSGGADELPVEVANICRIFADQLKRDRALLQENPEDNADDTEPGQDEGGCAERKRKGKWKALPSNAAKYAPHPNRHGSRTRAGGMDDDEGGRPAPISVKRRKKHDGSWVEGGAKECQPSRMRWLCKKLANGVAERVFGGDSPTLQAQYRRLRSALNQRLTEKGYLVEPLLPGRRLKDINFAAAPRGSLKKYSKAIKKDETAMTLWRRAMATTDSAVPSLDNLMHDARTWLEEEDSVMREVMPRAVEKAVRSGVEQREELQRRAERVMQQVTSTGVAAEQKQQTTAVRPSRVLVAVSTSGATAPQRAALLLAALVAARVQSASHIAVDGRLVAVPSEDSGVPLLLMAEGDTARETEVEKSDGVDSSSACPPVVKPPLPAAALQQGAETLFQQLASQREGSDGGDDGDAEGVDVLFLCIRALEAEEVEPEAIVQSLQSRFPLRSVLLHRMRPGEAANFRPRVPERIPALASDVTVDICFVMDLTASMGAWMDSATAHLAGIMRELKNESNIGRINVAFVGYRDFDDNGRVVVKPFVPSSQVEEVVQFIGDERASGGDDAPEDVISGFQAAAGLAWSGHIRFMVLVADAPAHGFSTYDDDNYPTGLCPDQQRGLESWTREIAEEKAVDLLFCSIDRSTAKMEAMFEGVYARYNGYGYGCLSLHAGAAAFRDALLRTLSKTLLRVFAPDAPGIQSFDGVALSSILSTCMSSLRESVANLASGLAGDKDDEEEGGEDGGGPSGAAGEGKSGRSDVMRLKAELEAEDLAPVRMALGLPVTGGQTLMVEAAMALLRVGVSVEEMERMGYPPEVVLAVRKAGQTMLKQL